MAPPKKPKATNNPRPAVASGEGERNAMRGYVPQYDLGGRVAYDALITGGLVWLGVADRGAGTFDDMVLGFPDRIEAYQVKTSKNPAPFRLKPLLVGLKTSKPRAEKLLEIMVKSRKALLAADKTMPVFTNYACDDTPSTKDRLGDKKGTSSAAFLKINELHGHEWSLEDWDKSDFGTFMRDLQKASGLDVGPFTEMWRATQFLHSGQGRWPLHNYTQQDKKRIEALANLLPKLVVDPSGKDRWTKEEILARLGWNDAFRLLHQHSFPIDALHQSNETTHTKLLAALKDLVKGYVSLLGPPGSGKSSLLAGDMLPIQGARVLRYTAFIPNEGQGVGRAEAHDFLHDMIVQFKQQHLGTTIMPGDTLPELRSQFQALLGEASERYRERGARTIIIVDGLDHVPREENPDHSFLCKLPLPNAIPDGVIFLLSSQKLDLVGLSKSVRDAASADGHQVDIAPLSREAVVKLAAASKLPDDVDRDALYRKTQGHPLSCRYVIQGLLNAGSREARAEWLANGPAYGGQINDFYDRAWHDIENEEDAKEALGLLACAEAPMSYADLDALVGEAAAEKALKAAKHLLRLDKSNCWSIFHNSFRLYLQEKLAVRVGGVADPDRTKRRYRKLADHACGAGADGPQRWFELRYRARAADHQEVANLATAAYFRQQFFDGRDPADIYADQRFGFEAVKALRDPDLMIRLMLSIHEIDARSSVLGDEVFDAYVALGDFDAAHHLLTSGAGYISKIKGYGLIEALIGAGRNDDAREVFHQIEPVEKLLGSEPVQYGFQDDELDGWASVALLFRSVAEFNLSLDRLSISNGIRVHEDGPAVVQARLKQTALFGQVQRHPDLDLLSLIRQLGLPDSKAAHFSYLAANAAFEAGQTDLAKERLGQTVANLAGLSTGTRINAAILSSRLNDLDLARQFLDGVESPLLKTTSFRENEHEVRSRALQIIHWEIVSGRLGTVTGLPVPPAYEGNEAVAIFYHRVAFLARLIGEIRGVRKPSMDPAEAIGKTLEFLKHAGSDNYHNTGRYVVDQVVHLVVDLCFVLAKEVGKEMQDQCISMFDDAITAAPAPLEKPPFRRAYARAIFEYTGDATVAADRLALGLLGQEHRPAQSIADYAETANLLAVLGEKDKARALLAEMHAHGLGFDLAAKKDPQYVFWRGALEEANAVDPDGRRDRLSFLGRLLEGMSHLEGKNTARRMVKTFLSESALLSPQAATAAADLVEETGLTDWLVLVRGLLTGAAKADPARAEAAAVVAAYLLLPTADEDTHNPFPALIELAPPEVIGRLAERALAALEVHAPPSFRVEWMEETVQAAAKRREVIDQTALTRWKSELPAKSSSSDSDIFDEVSTFDEFAARLEGASEREQIWAPRGFARVAATADPVEAKRMFNARPDLRDNPSCVEEMLKLAHQAGDEIEAKRLLAELGKMAKIRGGWSGNMISDATERYFRLKIEIEGPDAGHAAFDAFVDDLRHGREPISLLMSSLREIFELLQPRPAWPAVWAACQDELTLYRDYQRGKAFEIPAGEDPNPVAVIADVMVRAIGTTTLDLIHRVRIAARSLLDVPSGPEIVVELIDRLLQAGPHEQFEAARLAWECRGNNVVEAYLLGKLPALLSNPDMGTRQLAELLAVEWGQEFTPLRADLPAFYSLVLPDDEQSLRFRSSSGNSPTSQGLWTADHYTWTASLDKPIKHVAEVTGLSVAALRRRAAEFMAAQGGFHSFGPLAVKAQHRRLGTFDLKFLYPKLMPRAALVAMRHLVGELAAADAIDRRSIAAVLLMSGAYDPHLLAGPPVPRPTGVRRPTPPEQSELTKADEWLDGVGEDLHISTVEGWHVLAAASSYSVNHYSGHAYLDQYHGPSFVDKPQSLGQELVNLETVTATDRCVPHYPNPTPGAVVRIRPDLSARFDRPTLTLCPWVCLELGWHPLRDSPLTLVDDEGTVMAKTTFWCDGGVTVDRPHDLNGYGSVLVASPAGFEALQPYLTVPSVTRAWRAYRHEGRHGVRSATLSQ